MAVYKDNNGTWYISVRYVNWKGEHARKVKRGFATKREATDWERSFLHENAGNLDMSFETFVDLYKKNLKECLKLSTWQTKVSIIDTKILPYFKKKRINDIKVSDVVAWQNTLLNTLRNDMRTLNGHTIIWTSAFDALRDNPSLLLWGTEYVDAVISVYGPSMYFMRIIPRQRLCSEWGFQGLHSL